MSPRRPNATGNLQILSIIVMRLGRRLSNGKGIFYKYPPPLHFTISLCLSSLSHYYKLFFLYKISLQIPNYGISQQKRSVFRMLLPISIKWIRHSSSSSRSFYSILPPPDTLLFFVVNLY